MKKEKPMYNVWQNSVYVIKNAWIRDKSVLFVILAQIFLSIAISVVSLYLPKVVVSQITSNVPVKTLIFTILMFTTTTVILQAVKNYFDNTSQPKRIRLRVRVCKDILVKALTTDYANLEDKKFTDAKQKAHDVTNNNYASTEAIYGCFASIGTNLLGFVVYIILLVSVNPLILIITAITTIFGVVVREWANRWQHDHNSEVTAFNKHLWYIRDISEDYTMAKDIRLFAMTDWLKDIYNTNLKFILDFKRKVEIRYLIADIVDCITTFMREGLAYTYLAWQVLYYGLPVEDCILLLSAIGGFSGWIMGILREYSTLSMHSLNYCHLRSYLEYPNKFEYDQGEVIIKEENKTYSLELKNISFRYGGAEENTLENINLKINSGEKLAVVGLNGVGKTTLVKLLCGFYNPTEGQILLNGKDICKFNRKQYYTLFTAVFQEFNILPISIAENVSQLPTQDIDQNRLKQCLALANIEEKINSFPQGVNSPMLKDVNEDAIELSGGETQKLMLARAVYKNSPILILDEPTAALDPIAESELYNKYNELSKNKTSIYISHRLASTRFCDRIVLIDNKTICECGTHDELLKLGGKYTEMFEIQSKYYKEGELQ